MKKTFGKKTLGYAAQSATMPLRPYEFTRRDVRANDVGIEILYCGVCHTDLHFARNDWNLTVYPVVPGHEIIGRVIEVGTQVTRYKVGDYVGVGCLVDSCQDCYQCRIGEEQFCSAGRTDTYSSLDRAWPDDIGPEACHETMLGHIWSDLSAGSDNEELEENSAPRMTFGGYSKYLVVREEFVLRIPESLTTDELKLARAAPLLCAGITTYTPLRDWNIGPGNKIGVIGLGGLGHVAVKLAVSLGAEVTVISHNPNKASDAIVLGADRLLLSSDAQAMAAARTHFDFILDTIPVKHDINPYLPLLKIDGTLVLVGQIGPLNELSTFDLVLGRRSVSASFIGNIATTQEMLDFCARKKILPDCEIIKISDINDAFVRMERGEVRYRFVIDMASLQHPTWCQRLGLM